MTFFRAEELAAWTGGRWVGSPPPGCRGVGQDTRALPTGALFVALSGERRDGHAFVRDAFARGAAAALVDERFAAEAAPPGPLLAVPDPRRALAALARGHRARLRAEVLGVTGSLGKTTVKEMVADVLAAAGPTARSPASWNNDIGVPLSLLAVAPDDAFAVLEAGMNHPGELAPLCALIRPAWAVMTRIGPVHTEFFDGEAAIAREKAALLRALPPDGVAVLAADEPWFELLAAEAPGRIVTLAFDADADYRARPADGGIEVTERDGARHVYPVPLHGEPARRNALRAVAVGRAHGLAPDRIAAALARMRAAPMRAEVVERDGVVWINDAYNANPVSMRAALADFARRPAARRWIVLGGMRELADPAAEHRALGATLAGGPWAGVLLVGDAAAAIGEGARAGGWPADRIAQCPTPDAAAAWLAGRLRPGDAVLLKGSRMERLERVLESAPPSTPPERPACAGPAR